MAIVIFNRKITFFVIVQTFMSSTFCNIHMHYHSASFCTIDDFVQSTFCTIDDCFASLKDLQFSKSSWKDLFRTRHVYGLQSSLSVFVVVVVLSEICLHEKRNQGTDFEIQLNLNTVTLYDFPRKNVTTSGIHFRKPRQNKLPLSTENKRK